MQIPDIIGQQPADIRPARAPTQEVEFVVSLEIIDDRMLIDRSGITAGRTRCRGYIGYPGDNCPYTPRRSVTGRKTMVEKEPRLAKTVKERRRIQGIPPH